MRTVRLLMISIALSLPATLPAAQRDAVDLLLESAATHVEAGAFDRAAGDLERALRIEPRNAAIWHDLGQVRMHQGRYREAITLAERSDSLAGSDTGLRERNAYLATVARRLDGDSGVSEVALQLPPPVAPPQPAIVEPARPMPAETANAATAPPVPAPWTAPEPVFTEPAYSTATSFVELALAVLPALLGEDAFGPDPYYHDARQLPPAAWGSPEPYPVPPPHGPVGDLHFELAPGLNVSVRLPEQMLPADPLAAMLLNAVLGAVESDTRRRIHHEHRPPGLRIRELVSGRSGPRRAHRPGRREENRYR